MRKKYLNISGGRAFIECNGLTTGVIISDVGIPFWYNETSEIADKAIKALKEYVESKYPGWKFIGMDEYFKYEISDEEYSDAYKDNGRGYYDSSENKCPEGVFEAELVGHDFLEYDEFVEGTEYDYDTFTFVVLDFKINNEIYKFRVKLFDYDYSDGKIEEYFSWVKSLAVKTIKDESNLDSIFYGTKNKKYQIKIYYKNGNRIDFNHEPKLIIESTNKNTVTVQIKDDIYIIGVRFAMQTRGCYYYRCKKPEYKVGDTLFVPTQYGNKESRVVFVRTYKDKNEVLQDTKYSLDILKWAPEKKTLTQEELKKIEQERLAKEKAEKERLERERQERIRKEEENKKRILEEKTKFRSELISLKNKYKKDNYSSINFKTITNLISNFKNKLDNEKYLTYKQDYKTLVLALSEVKTLEQEEAERKRKKMITIITSTIVAIVILLIFVNNVIVPNVKYSNAINLIENGKYEEAEDVFYDLGDYKESKTYMKLISVAKKCENNNYKNAIKELESFGGSFIFVVNYDGGSKSNSYVNLYDKKINSSIKDGYTFKEYLVTDYYIEATDLKLVLNIKSIYVANNYSITYYLDGGSTTNPSTYTIEDTITLSNPTKTGYEFKGWIYSGTSTPKTNVKIEKGTTGNLNFSANWRANDYLLSFNSDGGNDIGDLNVTYDSNYSLPTPTKIGYEFKDWYNGSNLIPQTGKWNYANNLNLKAKWSAKEYTITYHLDGGSTTNPIKVTIEDTIVLTDPLKTGYEFKGWYKDGKFKEKITTISGLSSNLDLYARWEAKSYTVTFDSDGGNIINNQTINYDASYTLPTPTKTGYEFKGWYNGSNLISQTGTWNYTDNLNLKAKWSAKEYVITYHLDGGGTTNPTSYTIEDTIVLNEPIKRGYEFKGWYSDSYFNNQVYKIDIGGIGNKDFYAKWELITYSFSIVETEYYVRYDSNCEDSSINKIVKVTETSNLIYYLPTRSGYIFKGWYTTPECNEAYDFNSVIDSNITLYAGWYSASGNILYGNGGAQGRPCVVYFSALSDGTVTYSASGYKLSSSKAFDVSGKELEINSDGHIVVKTGDVICFVAYGTVNYYNSLGITVTTTCEFKDGNYATEKVTHNNYDVETNNKISIPTNVGVEFLGYFDSKGNQIVDSSGNVLSNIELIDNIKLYPKYE